jgi:hypothetical protein
MPPLGVTTGDAATETVADIKHRTRISLAQREDPAHADPRSPPGRGKWQDGVPARSVPRRPPAPPCCGQKCRRLIRVLAHQHLIGTQYAFDSRDIKRSLLPCQLRMLDLEPNVRFGRHLDPTEHRSIIEYQVRNVVHPGFQPCAVLLPRARARIRLTDLALTQLARSDPWIVLIGFDQALATELIALRLPADTDLAADVLAATAAGERRPMCVKTARVPSARPCTSRAEMTCPRQEIVH